jgi:hypothetical protein
MPVTKKDVGDGWMATPETELFPAKDKRTKEEFDLDNDFELTSSSGEEEAFEVEDSPEAEEELEYEGDDVLPDGTKVTWHSPSSFWGQMGSIDVEFPVLDFDTLRTAINILEHNFEEMAKEDFKAEPKEVSTNSFSPASSWKPSEKQVAAIEKMSRAAGREMPNLNGITKDGFDALFNELKAAPKQSGGGQRRQYSGGGNTAGAITPNQINFIKRLCDQKGVAFKPEWSSITKAEASKLIEKLNNYQK